MPLPATLEDLLERVEEWETIGTALGLTGKDARSRLYRYSRAS